MSEILKVDLAGTDYPNPDVQADVQQLSWLWSSCVKPILKKLKDSQASDSHELFRVWWIGTGIASGFPFHAAGQDSENTLNQIIPSSTSTIKSLSYARSCASRAAIRKSNESSILVVTMPTTPKHRPLPGVDDERLAIQHMNRSFCRIKVHSSGIRSCLEFRGHAVAEAPTGVASGPYLLFAHPSR